MQICGAKNIPNRQRSSFKVTEEQIGFKFVRKSLSIAKHVMILTKLGWNKLLRKTQLSVMLIVTSRSKVTYRGQVEVF